MIDSGKVLYSSGDNDECYTPILWCSTYPEIYSKGCEGLVNHLTRQREYVY